jgi:hypothetical protein
MAAPTTTAAAAATAKRPKLNKVELLKLEKDGLDVWADVLRYAKRATRAFTRTISPDALVRHLSAAAQRGPLHDAREIAWRHGERPAVCA